MKNIFGNLGNNKRRPDALTVATIQYYYKPVMAFFSSLSLRAYETAGLSNSSIMLGLGCNDEVYGMMLKEFFSFAGDIVGLDLNGEALSKAKSYNTGAYSIFINASATAMPFADETFSTVYANGVIPDIPDVFSALAEARRVIRPGGQFFCTVRTEKFRQGYVLARILTKIGFSWGGEYYKERMDKRCTAIHVSITYDDWVSFFDQAGFKIER